MVGGSVEELVLKPAKPFKSLNHVTLESSMNFICRRCGGILLQGVPPVGTVQKVLNGEPYHLICAMKTELEEKEHENRVQQRTRPNIVLPNERT